MQTRDRPHTLSPVEVPDRSGLLGALIHERYRVLEQIGSGGMGVVYRGRHEVLGVPLAIKVLHPFAAKEAEATERFRREAQAASSIGSDHIVEIRDFGTLEDGSTYIVMELVEGDDLYTVVSDGALDWQRARSIAAQLCEALGAAHAQGIVHRDLKLENVILTERRGQKDFVKLVDFGIAKVQGSASLTLAGRVLGTPEYMAPEQCSGKPVDHRADLYALGVMLYEMLTGQLPFEHPELGRLLQLQIHAPPTPPSAVRPDLSIPLALEAAVLRCLAKSPDARFQSMAELADALRSIDDTGAARAEAAASGRGEATTEQSGGSGARAIPETVLSLEPVPEPASAPSRPRASGDSGDRATDAVPAASARGPATAAWRRVAVVALFAIGGVSLAAAAWIVLGTAPPNDEQGPMGNVRSASATDPPGEFAPVAPTPVEVPSASRRGLDRTGPSAGGGADENRSAPDPATAPTPSSVEIMLHSTPEGASVFDASGALLGDTPLRLARPAPGQRLEVEVREDGYEPHPVLVVAQSAAELTVPLTPRAMRSRTNAPPPAAATGRAPDHRAPAEAPPQRGGEAPRRREFLDPWNAP